MKKNAEASKKAEQERRDKEKKQKASGIEATKKNEMEALSLSSQATKKFLMEIMGPLCPKDINPSGVEWPPGATRIVAKSVYDYNHIESVCLNRKGINDEEFEALIIAMMKNKSVRKLEMEGNSIEAAKSLERLTEFIKTNDTLQHLSLECNIRLYGNATKDQFKLLLDALRENESLLSVNFSFCGLMDDVLPKFKDMLFHNSTIINLQIYSPLLNDTISLRKIQQLVMANQTEFHKERKQEKEERLAMMTEFERLYSIKAMRDSNALMESNAEEHRKEYVAMKELEFQDEYNRRLEKMRRDEKKVQIEIANARTKKKGRKKKGK